MGNVTINQLFNYVQGNEYNGQSTYDIWKDIYGGTAEEFLDFLRGNPELPARSGIAILDEVNGHEYVVKMVNGVLTSTPKCIGIRITTQPNKTSYIIGEEFDSTGMVVVADCSDGSTREITNYKYSATVNEPEDFIISYTELATTYTATINASIDIEQSLQDFEYTDNNDGTYTITGWKETLNGTSSTECVIPNSSLITIE